MQKLKLIDYFYLFWLFCLWIDTKVTFFSIAINLGRDKRLVFWYTLKIDIINKQGDNKKVFLNTN